MDRSVRLPVVFLPGGVTPVALSFAPLLEELGGEISPLLKDLEVHAEDKPPVEYSIRLEARLRSLALHEPAANPVLWSSRTTPSTRRLVSSSVRTR